MMRGSGICLMFEAGGRKQETGGRSNGVVEWWSGAFDSLALGFLLVGISDGGRYSTFGTSEFGCDFPEASGPSSNSN